MHFLAETASQLVSSTANATAIPAEANLLSMPAGATPVALFDYSVDQKFMSTVIKIRACLQRLIPGNFCATSM